MYSPITCSIVVDIDTVVVDGDAGVSVAVVTGVL
jgi:hypothetical protein